MGMGGNVLENEKRKIADFINDYVKKNGYNVVLRNKELNALYEYTGDIMHKPSKKEEYVAGHWKDGVLVEWNPRIN